MANNSYKKFPYPYPLATVHLLQTNGRTDRRTTTHANSSTFTKVRSAKNCSDYRGVREFGVTLSCKVKTIQSNRSELKRYQLNSNKLKSVRL